MKVVAFVGSYRGEKSISLSLVKKLENELRYKFKNELNFSIITPDSIDIKQCIGCSNCFINGKCILSDNMDMIKDEILSSDLFIIASPVFIHNVPGSIKNLIDRLGYWTHLMRLTGKLGMVATISDNTGNEQVIKYLEKVMNYWGVAKLSSIDIKTVNMTDDAFDSYARYAVQNILNYYNDPIELIEPIQEKIFSNQKDQLKSKPLKTSEYNFWSDNKYFEYSSFKDLFSNKQSRPIKI